MASKPNLIKSMGSEPPILAGAGKVPGRRDISLRWLSGTFLTGITAGVLMGVALFAALDGREQLAIPGQALASVDVASAGMGARKGGRLVAPSPPAKPGDRSIMQVSTVVHVGDHDVVRRRPFAHLSMSLAANHSTHGSYPKFDPLKILATGRTNPTPASSTALFYGAQVDSEVRLKTVDFPVAAKPRKYASSLSLKEAERLARADSSELTSQTMQLASLYVPESAAPPTKSPFVHFDAGNRARITAENVSVTPMNDLDGADAGFADDVIAFRRSRSIDDALAAKGYSGAQAASVATALAHVIETSKLDENDVLRLGVEQSGDDIRIMRAGIYSGDGHLVTVARNDRGRFVVATPPPPSPAVANAFADTPVPTMIARNLPDLYDGIYRASLAGGMSRAMIGHVVKLLASKVDFKAEMKPDDSLEVFFSSPGKDGKATKSSELLFLGAHIDGKDLRLYRFRDPKDNSVDYYNAKGKSGHPFLLRDPVPNGVFTSPFGMRLHPILGYKRMHWGCDWGAPRGTPIISVGDGTVVKAGWNAGGYGKQTIIRYANGYESGYNHQSAIAKGIKPGAHVRQGQVIGYVGSSGESTGPHLHYEVIVNGSKVDPMKVRFPDRKPLQGDALVAFEHERKRIDLLLENGTEAEVASR